MSIKIIRRGGKRGIESLAAQIVLVVIILIMLILVAMPLLVTMVMSVKGPEDINAYPIWTLPKNGWYFSNYVVAFSALSRPMFNTVLIDLIVTFVVMFGSCYIAFLFERKRFSGKKAIFFFIIAPMMVPGVVLLSSTYIVVAQWLGLRGNWLGLLLPYIAGNQISSIFMLRVFLGQHPDSLYEAAQLDGANTFQVYFSICLPLAIPIMMVQGIGIFAAIYNDFLWPQLLFQGQLENGMLMPYLKFLNTEGTQGVQYARYLVAGIPLIVSTAVSIKFFISGDFASGMKL
jgi:ABC transporter, permease protein